MDLNINQTKAFLLAGFLGGSFSVIGDLLLSFNLYPSADTVYAALLASCETLSYSRLALSALFGGVGIPLQAFGVYAFSGLIQPEKVTGRRIVRLGALATALFGGVVHLLCVLLMLLVKVECLTGFSPLDAADLLSMFPPSAVPFIFCAVLPLSAMCMVPYYSAMLMILFAILKKKSVLPWWTAWFNPIVFVVVSQLIAVIFVPNHPLINGLNMANKAIGAVFMFGFAFFFLLKKGKGELNTKNPVC